MAEDGARGVPQWVQVWAVTMAVMGQCGSRSLEDERVDEVFSCTT
jgi:hypothetical protein